MLHYELWKTREQQGEGKEKKNKAVNMAQVTHSLQNKKRFTDSPTSERESQTDKERDRGTDRETDRETDRDRN